MKVCYICSTMYEGEHECEVSKRLLEHPIDLKGPGLTAKACPTRYGTEQYVGTRRP